VKMRIERRPTDVGATENLFHSDRVIRLLPGEQLADAHVSPDAKPERRKPSCADHR
jgi:hypothetical protein